MRKLSVSQKLGYGVGDVGGSLSYTALNTWLLYFLINIAGLSPILAGVTFILGRLLDAVLDPLMGMLSDRWRPRVGRLVFVRWGALPAGLSFVALWLLPLTNLPDAAKFLLAVSGFALFSALYTVVIMPYLALLPELAPDYDERTRVNGYRFTFALISDMLAFALPPVIVLSFTGASELASSKASGWLVMTVLFGAAIAASFFITGITVKESPANVSPPADNLSESLLGEVRSAFATHGFTEVFVLFIIVTVGLMVVNSMLPFYLESALRIGAELQPLVLGLLFGIAILALPAWTMLSSRIGKKRALVSGLLLQSGSLLALVAVVPAGRLSTLLLAVVVVNGIGVSAVTLLPWSMLPDVVEFDELERGRRREGMFVALFTFGQKIAGSVGVFANGIVAAAFGYQQGASVQSDFTIRGLQLMIGPIAALIFGLAIIAAWRYPITRESHRQAQEDLAARRRKKSHTGARTLDNTEVRGCDLET